jgi:hypothetical protein
MQLVRSMRVSLQRAGTAAAVAALTFLVSVAAAAAQDRRAEVVRIPFPRDEGSLTPYSFELGYPLVTLIYDTVMWRRLGPPPRSKP